MDIDANQTDKTKETTLLCCSQKTVSNVRGDDLAEFIFRICGCVRQALFCSFFEFGLFLDLML